MTSLNYSMDMKKLLFISCYLTILLFVTAQTSGQAKTNITGTWIFKVESSLGSGTPEMVLKQLTDTTFTGNYRGQLGETNVLGNLKGNKIYISFTISENLIEYEGLLEGEIIRGKVKLGTMGEGTFTGERKKP